MSIDPKINHPKLENASFTLPTAVKQTGKSGWAVLLDADGEA